MNIYDNPQFFDKYSQMQRSVLGLDGAGEWYLLKQLLPDFKGKRVLDLGCGYGWHCAYAVEHGAVSVTGIDVSEKMLDKAKTINAAQSIEYRCVSIEDYEYPADSYEIVISSLVFHYIESFEDICLKINSCLTDGGDFVFSVEHPIFTADGRQEWIYGENDTPIHWAVDNNFYEGKRNTHFLGEDVEKYHRSLTTYVNCLLNSGFVINGFCEPKPPDEILDLPGMIDELRRPMMLIISAKKLCA